MWKSASSSGWEHFIMCEDLGSSPMCATWMLFKLYVFVRLYIELYGSC